MFNIQILNGDLKKALQYVEATVGNNSQNNGDDCISITDDGNYQAHIYTTNSIEFSSIGVVLMNGSNTNGKAERMPYVNFKRFKKIIDSIDDINYIVIKSINNDIEITYGNKKPLKLTGSSNMMVNLPNIAQSNIGMVIDTEKLVDALKYSCTIIKDDTNNPIANCIRLHNDNFKTEVTSIDIRNNRMCLCTFNNTNSNSGDIIIEANKLNKIIKMFENYNSIEIIPGNVIKISGLDAKQANILTKSEYYIRQLTGNFPTTISSMFNYAKDFAKINVDDFRASLERINAIEDNIIGSGTMDISIDGDLINITKTSQYGVVEDSFSLENEIVNPIKDTFKFKPFSEILKTVTDSKTIDSDSEKVFQIANANIPNQNNCYIIKKNDTISKSYLITGFNSNNLQQTP